MKKIMLFSVFIFSFSMAGMNGQKAIASWQERYQKIVLQIQLSKKITDHSSKILQGILNEIKAFLNKNPEFTKSPYYPSLFRLCEAIEDAIDFPKK